MSDAFGAQPRHNPLTERAFWATLAISLATLTASQYVSGNVLVICAFGGLLLAVAAALMACVRLALGAGGRTGEWFGLILAALLLVGQINVACRTSRMLGHLLDGQPVVMHSLVGLGTAIHEYADTKGRYPESLIELVEPGFVHPKNLISPPDPGFDHQYSYADWPPDLVYSSYAYQPGRGPWANDSRIVLAYEYEAWHPMKLELFPEYGRFALFGDASVKLLDATAFNRALRDDVVRRRELGWPCHASRPVGEPPAATTTAATQGTAAAGQRRVFE